MTDNLTGLPRGSIVAMRDSALYKDLEDGRHPWSETAGFRLSDDYVRDMIDGGYAVVLRIGFDGSPPPVPEPDEDE
jgi:hypothetical protein